MRVHDGAQGGPVQLEVELPFDDRNDDRVAALESRDRGIHKSGVEAVQGDLVQLMDALEGV